MRKEFEAIVLDARRSKDVQGRGSKGVGVVGIDSKEQKKCILLTTSLGQSHDLKMRLKTDL